MISTRERLFEKKWKTLDARLRKMRSRRNSGEELSGFETRPNGGRMCWTEKVLRAAILKTADPHLSLMN